MPKLMPLYLLAAAVIAAAGSAAFAAPPSTNPGAVSATVVQSPRIGTDLSPNTRKAVDPTVGTAAFTPSKTTNTDVRNRDNAAATEGTRSSGPSPTTAGTTNANGGTNTPGAGANGPSNESSTGATGNNESTTSGNTTAHTTTNPLFLNGVIGGAVASDMVFDQGAALTSEEQLAQGAQVNGAFTNPAVAPQPAAADTARAEASLDRVINQASRERRKIGRDGQLLHSITPRTNADRSQEVPDDGPTPALKGLSPR